MTSDIRVRKDAPNVDSYAPEDNDLLDESLFEEEDETEAPARSSVVQQGWAAAKSSAKEGTGYTQDFRFSDDVQLVKFLSNEPIVFLQHWVNRPGKKSFVGWNGDPLDLAGNKPERKFAFSIVNFSAEEGPTIQLMTVGIRLLNQLEKLNSDKKTGPIDRPDIYWAVSKSGVGTKTTHSVAAVKERDLAEDWEIDPVKAAEFLKTVKPLGPEALRVSTAAELEDLAAELLAAQ
jgi:uncharacterized protein (UPF0335 family)